MSLKKIIGAFCLSLIWFVTFGQDIVASLPKAKNGFIVIAHRGSHLVKPENSIAAIQEAIEFGADYVEVDLRTTKDGFLILCHDQMVESKSNGVGKVSDLMLSEIQKLNLKSKDGKKYKFPQFKEVLSACKNKINVYLDFKEADAAEAYKEIQAAGMEKNVAVYLNKIEQYFAWRKVAPAMPLISSLPSSIKNKDDLLALQGKMQLEGIDGVTDTAMLRTIRENGLNVWLDVQSPGEGPFQWQTAMNKGVQGVQTDHPEALIAYLKKNKLRNGATVLTVHHPVKVPLAYNKALNIQYSFASEENVLDVYYPKQYDSAKVIVYIHGGSWVAGDKSEFPERLIDELVGKRKYIVVAINYRLAKKGNNKFPSQMEDVTSAMQFLTTAAKKFNFNAYEIALMGASSGAHMALLYAFGYDDKKQIKTIVDYWGPTDFTDSLIRPANSDGDKAVTNLLGDGDPMAKVSFDASPYHRLTKETGVPTAIFHGGADPLVNISQAQKLYKKLQSFNIPTELTIFPNEKHNISPGIVDELFGKTIAWLDKYFPAK
jgi:glycerophosphoryl diester phosphodiesterase